METNHWHQQILKTLPVPVILTNAEGSILSLNTDAAHLLAYDHENAGGRNILTIIKPMSGADRKDIAGLIALTAADNAGHEFLTRRGDGTAFYAEITATQVSADEGGIYSWVLQPLSKDKRVLKERTKELTAILEVTENLFKHTDLETAFNACMPSIKAGWQYPDHIGVRIRLYDGKEFTTEGFRETKWRMAAKVEREGEVFVDIVVCFVQELPDNNMIFLPEERKLINGVAKLLSLYLDQWHTLNKLKENEAHLKKVTAHIPGNIYQFKMTDSGEITILFASKGMGESNNNINVEALKRDSKNIAKVIHPDDLDNYFACLRASHLSGEDISVQYRTLVNGITTWRWMWAQAEKHDNGEVIWYGCTKDITTIIEYVDVLEQIVFDISHIIRRPVTTILGITDLINKMTYDELAIKMFADDLKKIASEMDEFTKRLNNDYSEKKLKMPVLKIGHELVNSNMSVNKRAEFFTIMDQAN